MTRRQRTVFIDHLYYQPVEFIQQGIQIVRCYRCQKFRHIASNCHSKVSCKHCPGEHSVDNCKSSQPVGCANCSENHEMVSLDCPFYITQVQIVYVARGVQAPSSRSPVSKNDGEPRLHLLAGLSDHGKTAINQYLQQFKAVIVVSNAAKTQISANRFDIFSTISCMCRCS